MPQRSGTICDKHIAIFSISYTPTANICGRSSTYGSDALPLGILGFGAQHGRSGVTTIGFETFSFQSLSFIMVLNILCAFWGYNKNPDAPLTIITETSFYQFLHCAWKAQGPGTTCDKQITMSRAYAMLRTSQHLWWQLETWERYMSLSSYTWDLGC